MSRRATQMAAVAAMVCSILAAFLATAKAQPPASSNAGDLWRSATEVIATGEEAAGVTLLNALVKQFPDDALADDALFLAASLLEESLGQPSKARDTYQLLLRSFPNSRTALAAERRLALLEQGLGLGPDDEKALVNFQQIMRGFPERGREQSIGLALKLIERHPQWPQLYRVHLWLAATTRKAGDLDAALAYFQQVLGDAAPNSAQIKALLGTAEVAILASNHERATLALGRLGERSDLSEAQRYSLVELRELLNSSKRRTWILSGSYAMFFIILLMFLLLIRKQLGPWRSTRAALARPNTELLYMLPLALLLTVMAFTGYREIGPAVALICGGGLLTTWLLTTLLASTRPLTGSRALLLGAAALLASASVCYVALQRSQLLDLVITTVRFGPE